MSTFLEIVAGRYHLEHPIGVGSSATVWRALDRAHGDRPVALKILRTPVGAETALADRFVDEVTALRRVSHPAIVELYGAFEERGRRMMALELIDGPTLEQFLGERAEPWSLEELWVTLGPIAEALDHAHAQGVIHRDVTPRNVMLRRDARPDRASSVLLDFSVASLDRDKIARSRPGELLGTLSHLAPEQLQADGTVVAETDVFAFAVLCFELLTLRSPWILGPDGRPAPVPLRDVERLPANATPAIFTRLLTGPRPRASTLAPQLPAGVDEALAAGLAIRSSERPHLAVDLLARLCARRGDTHVDGLDLPTELTHRAVDREGGADDARTDLRFEPVAETLPSRAHPPDVARFLERWRHQAATQAVLLRAPLGLFERLMRGQPSRKVLDQLGRALMPSPLFEFERVPGDAVLTLRGQARPVGVATSGGAASGATSGGATRFEAELRISAASVVEIAMSALHPPVELLVPRAWIALARAGVAGGPRVDALAILAAELRAGAPPQTLERFDRLFAHGLRALTLTDTGPRAHLWITDPTPTALVELLHDAALGLGQLAGWVLARARNIPT